MPAVQVAGMYVIGLALCLAAYGGCAIAMVALRLLGVSMAGFLGPSTIAAAALALLASPLYIAMLPLLVQVRAFRAHHTALYSAKIWYLTSDKFCRDPHA